MYLSWTKQNSEDEDETKVKELTRKCNRNSTRQSLFDLLQSTSAEQADIFLEEFDWSKKSV